MNVRRQHTGRPAWLRLAVVLGLVALTAALTERTHAQPPKTDGQPPKVDAQPKPAAKPGVSVNEPKAFKGYTLIAPMNSKLTHLIDMEGHVVKTWESEVTPGLSAYLLENGHLLRAGNLGPKGNLQGAGVGGRIQEFDWDGNLVWDYTYSTKTQQQHHDIHRMPNGNVLLVCWDKKTVDEATAAGRRPDAVRDHLMADCILEVKPTGKTSGEIVWEWHVWDHLVQDNDKSKANYGNVAQHPELIDINFGSGILQVVTKKDDLDKLRDLGYIGGGQPPPAKDKDKDGKDKDGKDGKGPDGKDAKDGKGPDAKKGPDGKGPGGPGGPNADWTHVNAVSYNADLDQIIISSFAFSEIWIVDHSTTTKEAAGHSGGKSGKGGDLLYRWGNPRAYRAGTNSDQRLFNQHNVHWIPKGYPGEGHLILFNNGGRRPDGSYSSVDEIVLPVGPDGKYARKPGLPYGPDKALWSYTAEKKTDFFASFISGADRLPNGNTLICSGPDGTVFEVTPEKEIVWKFVNPRATGGGPGPGPGGMGGPIPFVQDQLKLTDEQKKQIAELQKEIDAKIEKVLTDDQKKQFKEMRDNMARMVPPKGGPMVVGGGPGPGGMFRAYRYGPDFPGLVGKDLKPGKKIEELGAAKN
jgi:hypothetical protein